MQVWVTHLVFFEAVLEDILDNQTSGLAKGNLMPHTTESFIDIFHDLRRRVTPTELEQFLPHMASVAMDDSLWDATKQLMYHDGLVFFWDSIESLLNDVASEGVHAQAQCVATDGVCNRDDLVWCSMLEASLYKEVSESIDHQRVGLSNDCLNDFEFLLDRADLELLLQEDRSLLVIVANDLVNNVLPIASDASIEKTPVVEWLHRRDVGLTWRRRWL